MKIEKVKKGAKMTKNKDLYEQYNKVREKLEKDSFYTPEQRTMYLVGWLDCALYVLREEEKND